MSEPCFFAARMALAPADFNRALRSHGDDLAGLLVAIDTDEPNDRLVVKYDRKAEALSCLYYSHSEVQDPEAHHAFGVFVQWLSYGAADARAVYSTSGTMPFAEVAPRAYRWEDGQALEADCPEAVLVDLDAFAQRTLWKQIGKKERSDWAGSPSLIDSKVKKRYLKLAEQRRRELAISSCPQATYRDPVRLFDLPGYERTLHYNGSSVELFQDGQVTLLPLDPATLEVSQFFHDSILHDQDRSRVFLVRSRTKVEPREGVDMATLKAFGDWDGALYKDVNRVYDVQLHPLEGVDVATFKVNGKASHWYFVDCAHHYFGALRVCPRSEDLKPVDGLWGLAKSDASVYYHDELLPLDAETLSVIRFEHPAAELEDCNGRYRLNLDAFVEARAEPNKWLFPADGGSFEESKQRFQEERLERAARRKETDPPSEAKPMTVEDAAPELEAYLDGLRSQTTELKLHYLGLAGLVSFGVKRRVFLNVELESHRSFLLAQLDAGPPAHFWDGYLHYFVHDEGVRASLLGLCSTAEKVRVAYNLGAAALGRGLELYTDHRAALVDAATVFLRSAREGGAYEEEAKKHRHDPLFLLLEANQG